MKRRIYLPVILSLFVIILLSTACIPIQTNEPAPVQVDTIDNLALLIEGRIVPKEWVQLSFSVSGIVEETYYQEGDHVKKGDVIAQLKGYQQLAASLSVAELEFISAQQDYDLLQENHEIIKAQAIADRIALEQAIETAQLEMENLKEQDFEIDIEQARANIVLLEKRLESAENLYDEYEDWSDTSITKADARINLASAREQLEEGTALLYLLENRDKELEIERAEAELSLLNERLFQAQERENDLQKGPLPEDMSLADQRLVAARTAVDAAQEALESLRLMAPMDGQILESSIKVGQLTMAGQNAVILADTSEWLVETNNLTEIDRVGIQVGQSVTVIPDSYPSLEISGKIQHISDYFQENRGDITYRTMIKLEPTDAGLHWGMTVLINFED